MLMISLGQKHPLKQETGKLLFTNPSPCCSGGWSIDRDCGIAAATLRCWTVGFTEIGADDLGISEEGQTLSPSILNISFLEGRMTFRAHCAKGPRQTRASWPSLTWGGASTTQRANYLIADADGR